jgi:hypothetical protein
VLFAKGFLEFFRALEGPVGGGVVDDDDFPVYFPVNGEWFAQKWWEEDSLLREDIVKHLHQNWEILALIVGGQDDRVLVVRRAHLDERCRESGNEFAIPKGGDQKCASRRDRS